MVACDQAVGASDCAANTSRATKVALMWCWAVPGAEAFMVGVPLCDVEVSRGGGDVPLGCAVIACEFTRRFDGHGSGRVDSEPESFVERDVLIHAEHARGVSALERKGRTTRRASVLVPSVTLQPMLTPPLTRRRVVDLAYVSAAACPGM